MRRRGFLKLLGLLPFVPALAEVAAKAIKPTISGADQTSIWIASYADDLGVSSSLLDFANRYKDDSRILPVVEALSQRNPLLQEMTWRGPAPKRDRINWSNKIRYMPTRRKS